MKNKFLVHIYLLLSFGLIAQPSPEIVPTTSSKDSVKSGIGGELKGMNIAGAIAIGGGIGIGIYADGFSDTGRSGIDFPLITAGLTVAPASLIGLGLGSLFGKKKSNFSRSFQLGTGVTIASVLLRNPPNEEELVAHYIPGLNIRILSNEIGKWRYNLGLNYFFKRDYMLFGRTERTSWQSVNLDLQYLFYLNKNLKIYPLVGTQYNRFLKDELYTNYGAGLNFEFIKNWNFYLEAKVSFDPDENPSRANFSFGGLWYL